MLVFRGVDMICDLGTYIPTVNSTLISCRRGEVIHHLAREKHQATCAENERQKNGSQTLQWIIFIPKKNNVTLQHLQPILHQYPSSSLTWKIPPICFFLLVEQGNFHCTGRVPESECFCRLPEASGSYKLYQS